MIETVHGIVLRAEDSGEFDQRLIFYTREMGKIRAKIAGVKKNASKLRSLALPCAESRVLLYLHGSKRAGPRDPGKVVGGEVLDLHLGLRTEWDRMLQCAAFCETLDRMTHPFYPHREEYELLSGTLSAMETAASPVLVRLRSTLILLKNLGYGLRHHTAWKNLGGRKRELLLKLGRWNGGPADFSPEETAEIKRVVESYLAEYLLSPLKSQEFERKLEAARAAP